MIQFLKLGGRLHNTLKLHVLCVKDTAWLRHDLDRATICCAQASHVVFDALDLPNQQDLFVHVALHELKVDTRCWFRYVHVDTVQTDAWRLTNNRLVCLHCSRRSMLGSDQRVFRISVLLPKDTTLLNLRALAAVPPFPTWVVMILGWHPLLGSTLDRSPPDAAAHTLLIQAILIIVFQSCLADDSRDSVCKSQVDFANRISWCYHNCTSWFCLFFLGTTEARQTVPAAFIFSCVLSILQAVPAVLMLQRQPCFSTWKKSADT